MGSRAGTPAGFRGSVVGDTSLLEEGEADGADGGITPTARRTTLGDGAKGSGIPMPGRRQSGGLVRRQSGVGEAGGGEMLPPASTAKRERKAVDVGETF